MTRDQACAANHAKRRKTQLAVDQHPVGGGIDQVRGDQRVHHRTDDVHRLEVAAEHGVGEERRRRPDHVRQVRPQVRQDVRMQTERRQRGNQRE
jgi:hypothetical protein